VIFVSIYLLVFVSLQMLPFLVFLLALILISASASLRLSVINDKLFPRRRFYIALTDVYKRIFG